MLKIFKDIAQCRVNPRTGTPNIVMTSGAVDAEHDRMLQDQLTFRIPLAVMLNHDYKDLPVGQVDTQDQIVRAGDGTVATFRWLTGDERAARVKNAFDQGMLRASIGMTTDSGGPNAFGGFDMSGRVHEVSLTAVPANEDCQALFRDLFGSGRPGPPNRARAVNRPPGWWLPRDATLTIIDSDDDLVSVSDGVFRAAFAEVIGREVQRQLNLLTGRVD
jgi:hypothetical protein